jgi:uncharacterized protein
MAHEQTVIIYHGKCPDGFGGAYAAWKKFGDAAEYIPMNYSKPDPEHMDGRDLYFIDFCLPQERMDALAAVARSLTVLDHHEGIRAVATSFPGVFDPSRSGATIAWEYFHPNTPAPFLFEYLEDYDLFRFALPDTKGLNAYLTLEPYDFERWDEIIRALEDPESRAKLLERGRIYAEHTDKLIEHIGASADLVELDGHTVYLSGTVLQAITDYLGHALAEKQPPFAIMVRPAADGLRVSLRSAGNFDVAELARKYGGNGHPGASAFRIPWGEPVPWKTAPKSDEDSRD